jgi:hypothetical protein
MSQSSKKPSFGQDLVDAMKFVLAHHRGEIEPDQLWPKLRLVKSTRKRTIPRAK